MNGVSPPRLERRVALDDFASTTVSWRDLHVDQGETGASLKDQFKMPQTARQEVSRLQRQPTTLFAAKQLVRGQSSVVMRKSVLRGGQVRTIQRLRSMRCGSLAARKAARAVRWIHEHPFVSRSVMANFMTLSVGLVVAAIVGAHQPLARAPAQTPRHLRAVHVHPASLTVGPAPAAGALVDRTAREEAKPTTPGDLALGVLFAMPALILLDTVRRTNVAVMWSRLTEFFIMVSLRRSNRPDTPEAPEAHARPRF